jgi:hypothetical protein
MYSQTQTLSSARWVRTPEDTVTATGAHAPGAATVFTDNPDFFVGKSILELAQSQGVVPVEDIGVFAGGIPDEENVDEMLDEIYRQRAP